MAKINILSDLLVNKIAAGEVIERPASVVKELVENSIDAESTDIRVEVVKGGKRLVKISDNGIGMERDDALLCFQRHATSKLSDEGDLFRINTMGFRGEALSSIASVSKVKLSTAPAGSALGTQLEISGGHPAPPREIACVGTTIEVRDLFFNIPARKKFLKTDQTEIYHIIDAITRPAIINPEVGFRLVSDGRDLISASPGRGLRERMVQIYGSDFLRGLKEIDFRHPDSGIRIEGFVSARENVRKTRAHQFLFVNKRPVSDPSIRHAVYRAYEGLIARDDHPLFFLHIALDPAEIDVNVHPSKREIRFLEKRTVYDLVVEAVSGAFAPGMQTPAGFTGLEIDSGESSPNPVSSPHPNNSRYSQDVLDYIPQGISETEKLYTDEHTFMYLGDVFAAYPCAEGLCIIDHHAAHERILYERLRKGIDPDVHRLLFPKQVRLSPRDYEVVLKYAEVLKGMGIELEDFGGKTVLVRAVPAPVGDSAIDGILSDLAAEMMDFKAGSPLDSIKDRIAKRLACHSSVRGERILGREQLSRLIRDLDSADDPHHCPHGRPTRIYFSLDDLRKLFERK